VNKGKKKRKGSRLLRPGQLSYFARLTAPCPSRFASSNKAPLANAVAERFVGRLRRE
jgi:hypothetical protein